MTFFDYIDNLKNKKIVVIGLGVSNLPLIRTLVDNGLHIIACDKRDPSELSVTYEEMIRLGVELRLGESYLDNIDCDVIFRTPGVMPFNEHLKEAKKKGAIVTSEMEAFLSICPSHVIAVTGSDGKTTTTTIIYEFLKAAGYRVFLGGNIGHPLFSEVSEMSKNDYVVLELSSFQLHSMKCSPDIAVITNVSPNHLDKHPSFDDYIEAKSNIFVNQNNHQRVILNFDNMHTQYYADKAKSDIMFFSFNSKVNNGVYFDDGIIYSVCDGNKERVLSAKDIIIPGDHNIQNYMAAIAAVKGIVSNDICADVAKSFRGVEHRLEFVREVNGVTYINDSIGTSPTRTIAGLHAMKKKPILIAGGYDKHIPFNQLGDEICLNCKSVFITGATSDKIFAAVTNSKYFDSTILKVSVIDDFTQTVYAASESAISGDIVLLSPACAAFDRFNNFMERGKFFKDIVRNL